MTLTIELSDQEAAVLKAQAEPRGMSSEEWVHQQLAEGDVPEGSIVHLQWENPKEWARQFHEWDGTTVER